MLNLAYGPDFEFSSTSITFFKTFLLNYVLKLTYELYCTKLNGPDMIQGILVLTHLSSCELLPSQSVHCRRRCLSVNFKQLLLKNHWAISTKLGMKHSWRIGIQVCSNKGAGPLRKILINLQKFPNKTPAGIQYLAWSILDLFKCIL